MAILQPSGYSFQIIRAPILNQRKPIMATLSIPDIQMPRKSWSDRKIGTGSVFMDVGLSSGIDLNKKAKPVNNNRVLADSLVVEKLHAIMEAVADRVEMHKNIGDQRNNWNTQLLTSINAITLAAATMAGIATTGLLLGAPVALALKMSSTLMYISATGLLIIMNKIQPSQLVEEQRNAVRLFQQLHNHIQTTLQIGAPNGKDVKNAMDNVLALDKAYPLPLLGGVMLPKFPSCAEPAVWWPKQRKQSPKVANSKINGWNGSLEEEMRQIVEVIRKKDKAEYLRLGGKALKMNKVLAMAGPLLTAMGALGSAFLGSSSPNSWAAIFGIVGGALASVVNTLEHGGQVGMVCEMYRNNAGFFDFMEESMENNYTEKEVTKRENGELLELKVALQLGRSLSELRDLASSSSSSQTDHIEEFASKLF